MFSLWANVWKKCVQIQITGSEKIYKADMVLLAMGFLGPEKKIIEEMSLKMDPRGNIQTPEHKYSTSVPHVYAAGGRLGLNCPRVFLFCICRFSLNRKGLA